MNKDISELITPRDAIEQRIVKDLEDHYVAGIKAGYNQCRTEAAIRIAGFDREYASVKRTHDASITVIRDLLKDIGANLSELPSVKRAHDLIEQIDGVK